MINRLYIIFSLLLGTIYFADAQVGQIDIDRIEIMPNQPSPFNMRNWSEVALQYDSFVYDIQQSGQYLPLINFQPSGLNYPENPAYGLHTYVGTNSPQGKEAINILPSLVGATLVGIDKSDQFNQNFVLMSQDFFSRNDELIYLNNPGASSGNDWWYDMMPNIYFYQLYDLYPTLGGDEVFQFTSVADQFLAAVKGMDGSDTPWQPAYMNYRAWDFAQMQANADGVEEPEAAGAYAWILYHAWKQTGNPEYLKGAEWSMEFLSNWTSNPSYELQLAYGISIAAKMNAEIQTDYDVEKMMNWAFDRGQLRGWGSIVGNWNGLDVHGLIGEANDSGNDYAFQMNGLQQAACLAPMVRYDKRYARAVGKWLLNLANANRLFYPGALPDFLQDASDWTSVYDPDRVIGYEALRETWQGLSPFSTGDAVGGGWAATNLALYGTSSIGYLGALLENTSDDKILKIDVLKTDFFGDEAYPTYLLFNPYSESKMVELHVGNDDVDLYEALSESFILQDINGLIQITIPANEAMLLTMAPANGTISYDKNIMLIDDVRVDYQQTTIPFHYGPRIQALASEKKEIQLGDSTEVFAKAFDQDSDSLTYIWNSTGGTITNSGDKITWHAPANIGNFDISVIVSDELNQRDTAIISVGVVAEINDAPEIIDLVKSSSYVSPGNSIQLDVVAIDPNADSLSYEWTTTGGTFIGEGASITYVAPTVEGVYEVTVKVSDEVGLFAERSTMILVKDFASTTGNLIAHYPFAMNGLDVSGNDFHGQVSGAQYTTDYFGISRSALLTDGLNDRVTVENNSQLNFQNAITVSCWFNAKLLPDNEIFLLSHGSWQNRWKISITPEQKIRWTINSTNGIRDLDSEIKIREDSFYHMTVAFDGQWMTMYLNGELQSYLPLTGAIKTTTFPLLMAQMLPDNTAFNYRGILDEVKIFDYAFTPAAAQTLYQESMTAIQERMKRLPELTLTPNPAFDHLIVQVPDNFTGDGQLSVYNLHGQCIDEQHIESESELILSINSWQAGIYIIILETEQSIAMGRFIKL
jgi:hypothetical protein